MRPRTTFLLVLAFSLVLTACSTLFGTPTPCPYVQNPGPAPAEVVTRAQNAFAATGLPGSVNVTGYGEYQCDKFGLMGVDFQFNLTVADFTDQKAMAALAAQVKSIPQAALQGASSLGQVKIRFTTATQFCWWDDASQTCGQPLNGP
jgi:hypothetical protein